MQHFVLIVLSGPPDCSDEGALVSFSSEVAANLEGCPLWRALRLWIWHFACALLDNSEPMRDMHLGVIHFRSEGDRLFTYEFLSHVLMWWWEGKADALVKGNTQTRKCSTRGCLFWSGKKQGHDAAWSEYHHSCAGGLAAGLMITQQKNQEVDLQIPEVLQRD